MTFERAHLLAMEGYIPGEQPLDKSVIKLNTNENPYPPSDKVAEALQDISAESLRRYPPPLATEFREIAADLHGVKPENILPTNGGDELLRLVITTFVESGDVIAVTQPSYSLYPVLAEVQNSSLVEIPLDDDWSMPRDFANQLIQSNAKLAIIVNPHAPTGALLGSEYIDKLANAFAGVLLIDEAYVDFVDPEKSYNSLPLVRKYDNVLILRTLSKGYSLAGLRFGYGIGAKSLIEPMMFKTRDSYNTDFIAQKLAAAALASQDYAQRTWDEVRHSRESLAQQLEAMGIHCAASETNFLLCSIPQRPGALAVYEALKASNILVRYFDQHRLRDKLRISIGRDSENQKLVSVLREIITT